MNNRKRFEWRYRDRRVSLGERTLVIGIIQVAPEYQPGGRDPLDPDRGFALATELEEAGADMIFGCSDVFLPGVKRTTDAEELRRIVPLFKRLRDRIQVPLGVVTDKSTVAERVFELGVEVVMDPGGLTADPELAKAAANHDAGFIVSNMRGAPEYWPKLGPLKDPAGMLFGELEAALGRARRGGLSPASLIVDPGLGMGKRKEQDVDVLANLTKLARLEVPLCVGAGNLAAVPALPIAALNGAHIVHCSDVKSVRTAVDLADAVLSVFSRQAEKAAADIADSSVSPAVRRPFGEPPPRRK